MTSIFLTVTDGKITSDYPISQAFSELEDGRHEVQITKVREQRSLNQNSYFHGVCLPMIAEEIGNVYPGIPRHLAKIGLAETKEAIKNRFLPQTKKRNPFDRRRKIIEQKGTSDLDKKEFRDFIEVLLTLYPFIPPPENPGDWESIMREYEKRYGRGS